MSPRHSRGKAPDTRAAHAYKPLSLRGRVWITAGAVVLGGAGVVTYAMADPATTTDGAPAHRTAAVHTVSMQTKDDRKVVPQKSTQLFSAVTVTWSDPEDKLDGSAQFRSRDAESGDWSAWTTLPKETIDADGAERERAALRGGTASVPTKTDANGVEVRVVDADGEASGLPSGMDVKLIDPGTGSAKGRGTGIEPAAYSEETTAPAETPDPSATTATTAPESSAPESSAPASASDDPKEATTSAAPTTSAPQTPPAPLPSTVVKPHIITQAQWGAGTNYDGTPTYDTEIKAAVVHHTGVDSDNSVPCSQSAKRLREIQQEHIAKGYYDIGYNFVVDRCGQIFEGRSGGMDLPVHGAHDYGFNTDTVGISYIGNFESAKPTKAALDAISRVVAWKFGQYGITATDKVTLTSNGDLGQDGNKVALGKTITLPRVFGHKDTNSTLCPGANLYPKLSRIATQAAAPGISHALPSQNLTGDATTDLVAGIPKGASGGQVALVPGAAAGPTTTGKLLISQSTGDIPGAGESGDEFGASTATGDVNGDGYTDLVVGQPGEDDTTGHKDRGAYTIVYGPGFTTGTGVNLDASYDLSGARFGSAVAVGDFNADGTADVFAASSGFGGTWSARYGDGWDSDSMVTTSEDNLSSMDATSGDFNRDGYADVALNYRDGASLGKVVWYKGGAGGLRKAATLTVKGGRSIASGDLNGDGVDDIVIGQPYTSESAAHSGGQVTAVYGAAGTGLGTKVTTVHQSTSGVPGASESGDAMGASVAVGDYNADGYADVLTGAPNEDITRSGKNQSNAGTSLLLKGSSAGLTGTGAIAVSQDEPGVPGSTETNDNLGSSAALADLSGYGRADLVLGVAGEDAGNGTLLYVPSNSSGLGLSTAKYYGVTQIGSPAGARLGTNLAP